ncbi:MAG: endonuclease/exonuclease/phosphatase family protein [Burkholderiales bacterium]
MNKFRVATYNIHKGVQGIGPQRRLEIHNLGYAMQQLDADVVCLQEVRLVNRKFERHFKSQWPQQSQAEFLAPVGYESVYRTNAVTRHGEHGNALLSRWPVDAHQHHDISDHRFEQRGLLHVQVNAHDRAVHVIVVHLGLIPASRIRQIARLREFIEREVPVDAPLLVAGDFNDWGMQVKRSLRAINLIEFEPRDYGQANPTYPARLPIVQLDHVYARGLTPLSIEVPRGPDWYRMSDHLPLLAEFGF